MFLKVNFLYSTAGNDSPIYNINFSLNKGEVLCIIGPSGSGKSRLLRAIGGFVKTDAAMIELAGQDITKLAPEDREIATVFQSFDLFPHMSVLENVVYGLKSKNLSTEERNQLGSEMLEKLGLKGFEDRDPLELSGGEQQRVAIARALVVKPKLLLLDEPFSNLDPKMRVKVREEIKKIREQREMTVIYITHLQDEVFDVSDKIIILNQGKIEQFGTSEEIVSNPANDFVCEFLSNIK